ncbi:NUDIX hydrolase [Microbacterium mangrovi]|uniref:NUDIX hydrolase n=1 Tax=Microbacterium mangrovi TaxID=1348253 RepID=A0A0B2A3E2_9MICO|nr:NUDIX hydrolase [Microbacterium mangrovi]
MSASEDARQTLQRTVDAGIPWRFARLLPPPRQPREAAVLILFGAVAGAGEATPLGPDELDVVLQLRAATLGSHPGQVSFPGGGREPGDADAVATALREAVEETGLDPSGVEVLGSLAERTLPASDHVVTPVVGWWRVPSAVTAVDAAETAAVARVPLAQLLDPGNRFTSVFRRGDRAFRGPAFDVHGTIVWGFTAMLLDDILESTGWARPWDRARERDI